MTEWLCLWWRQKYHLSFRHVSAWKEEIIELTFLPRHIYFLCWQHIRTPLFITPIPSVFLLDKQSFFPVTQLTDFPKLKINLLSGFTWTIGFSNWVLKLLRINMHEFSCYALTVYSLLRDIFWYSSRNLSFCLSVSICLPLSLFLPLLSTSNRKPAPPHI